MTYRNKKYDKDLRNIAHYKKHPQMIPFVGRDWDKMNKMLVVGESHYFNDDDNEATKREVKNTWKNWYNITDKELTSEQLGWTSIAEMINDAITNDRYESGWRIWKNVKDAIKETGFKQNIENTSEILCSIAFINFFQRPALESGESIIVGKEDMEIANNTLKDVVNIIGANYIFFVSSKVWKTLIKN